MPELDRGTWTLAYDVAGAAAAPAALLIHDIPDDRRVWRALATDMVEVFRTIAPDLRGFGESGQPPDPASPPAMRDYAADLAALLDAEGVAACAVIGAGFGAEVALELALDAPDRVDLIVVNGALPAADAFAAAHAARGARDDLLTRLAALPVPALVVAGAEDPLLPAARLLAETLPNGRFEVIEGCGRGAPFDAPQAFEGALGAFLGDVRAAGAHP